MTSSSSLRQPSGIRTMRGPFDGVSGLLEGLSCGMTGLVESPPGGRDLRSVVHVARALLPSGNRLQSDAER